ncbi:type I-F CRISPR-associated protein Csy1 [Pseudomonas entomophila]|uniref:type I-F CRISPR-associated protein Csy1 n=1 Tax=Pseudomonas entomophila TaxID=312306 RepID=UPI002404ADA0|nr:type I-F CRISPR-associated protein Csy1 [Pseudomonas entomophila]MDF9619954.1 type I-F CRISPR-associated protein Csy1 [Pseudomonas entomophila]
MEEKLTRSSLFRSTITRFITDRRDTKLNGKDDPVTAAKYEYSTWLADAARRVTQIQAVTHVLKATHPDARGSSLFVDPKSLPSHEEVGSHSLGNQYATDIVGNAAALDVYKFLKLQVEDRTLLDWLQHDDPDLLSALTPDVEQATAWAAAFKGLVRQGESVVSHEKAKQLYWCVGDDPTQAASFHLLQPLFPSSLVHAVHAEINDARFGEANKLARQARRNNEEHGDTYREYRELVARKLGGTKPQNISQLNSERGGVNYLLASLPPTWKSLALKPLLSVDCAFSRFHRFDGVQRQLNALYGYFKEEPAADFATRKRLDRIQRALGLALNAFGLNIRTQLPAGWTRTPECHLPLCEQVWLDPGRASLEIRANFTEEDLAFQRMVEQQTWPDEVAKHFALWLNNLLRHKGFPVSDTEHFHWARKALEHTLGFTARQKEASRV